MSNEFSWNDNLFCFMYLSKDFVETSNNSQASTLVMSSDW